MRSKTHKTAAVIIPPEEAWPPIQAIRKKHDRQFRRWMPHITLIYPFRPVFQFDPLTERFAGVCSDLRPFQLELQSFNLFRHSNKTCTIWLAPEPEGQLVELQTRLWEVVPDCDEVSKHPNGFTPHLSMGQARGRDIAIRLINDWQSKWRRIRFTVSEIFLIWRNDPPDDVFRIGKSIQLGSMP